MKTIWVQEELFNKIMEKIGAVPTGVDNGMNHGKYQWTRHYNRWVGESSFVVNGQKKDEWLFRVAAYLYEAYKDI